MTTTDNQLKNAFGQIRLETPSAGFTEKLTFRIEKEIRKKERKQKWITAAQLALGVVSILAATVGVLYWQSKIPFSFLKTGLSFDPLIWVIGLSILLLLISDTLIRKHIHS
jgi:hypothetical protein